MTQDYRPTIKDRATTVLRIFSAVACLPMIGATVPLAASGKTLAASFCAAAGAVALTYCAYGVGSIAARARLVDEMEKMLGSPEEREALRLEFKGLIQKSQESIARADELLASIESERDAEGEANVSSPPPPMLH